MQACTQKVLRENFLYGSELYSLIDNAVNGKDYDVLSAASISVVNDLAGDVQSFCGVPERHQ